MRVTLTDEAQRYARRFAEVTGVTPVDLLVADDESQAAESESDDHPPGTRLVVVVPAGRKGEAVGPAGATVERAESVLGARIDLVEHAESAATFVANTLAPAAVRDVTVSQMGVAFVEVLEADRGVAIGSNGENIAVARRLAKRHFDLDDVQLA